MRGRITKGTTIRGGHVNAGDVVDVHDDDYHKLLSTGDIEPIPAEVKTEPATKAAPAAIRSPKPKKKRK